MKSGLFLLGEDCYLLVTDEGWVVNGAYKVDYDEATDTVSFDGTSAKRVMHVACHEGSDYNGIIERYKTTIK